MRRLLSCSLVALALHSAPATAADILLEMDDTVPFGGSFDTRIVAPPGSIIFFMSSPSVGPPLTTKWGTLELSMPLLGTVAFPMPPSGDVTFGHPIECDSLMDGMTGFFQFAAIVPGDPSASGFSNVEELRVVPGTCTSTGDFATFTQGGWGTSCSGNNPGCLRDEHFPDAFPTGLLIGDQDGLDGDGFFAALFTSSLAVEIVLPEGGPSKALDVDAVDPTGTAAGVLAGQTIAAKLNVGFDDGGFFDPMKTSTGFPLGDLVYYDGVAPALIGLTVREVILLADLALAGETLPDGTSASDVSDALDALNNNFVEGTTDGGKLALPGALPPSP